MKLEEFNERLKKLDKAYRDQFIKQETTKGGLKTIGKVKERTPVDTGLLKRSWWLSQPTKISGGYEITIKNNVDYASYVEFGHLLKSGKFYPPRFMLKKSINELEKELPVMINDDLVDLWNNAIERNNVNKAINNVYGE